MHAPSRLPSPVSATIYLANYFVTPRNRFVLGAEHECTAPRASLPKESRFHRAALTTISIFARSIRHKTFSFHLVAEAKPARVIRRCLARTTSHAPRCSLELFGPRIVSFSNLCLFLFQIPRYRFCEIDFEPRLDHSTNARVSCGKKHRLEKP